jgi:hypothetical protein
MPILYLLTLTIQAMFAYHAYRTGRDRYWIYIILIFPTVGALVYFLAEIMPELYHGKAGQTAQKGLQRALDPTKELRSAQFAVDTAPTVANRIKLAQVLMERQDYDGAIAQLLPALTNHFADDPLLLEGLAYAYFHKGDMPQALQYVEQIYGHKEWPPKDYIKLLRARLYQETGELETAQAALTELVKSFSGEEARIALAQLRTLQGADADAKAIYQDIVTRTKHAPKHYQKTQREWIDLAKKGLRG